MRRSGSTFKTTDINRDTNKTGFAVTRGEEVFISNPEPKTIKFNPFIYHNNINVKEVQPNVYKLLDIGTYYIRIFGTVEKVKNTNLKISLIEGKGKTIITRYKNTHQFGNFHTAAFMSFELTSIVKGYSQISVEIIQSNNTNGHSKSGIITMEITKLD